jgi:hypothetical protein
MVLVVPAAHFIAIMVTIAVMVPGPHHGLRVCHGHSGQPPRRGECVAGAQARTTVFSIPYFPRFFER